MSACGHSIRGYPGETCKLRPGHRGHHSCVVFECDGCGRTLRGRPHVRENVMAYGEVDDTFQFCFLCAGPPAERAEAREREQVEREHYGLVA